jgi:hypothetical protein
MGQTIQGIRLCDRNGALIASCQPPAEREPVELPALQRFIALSDYANWLLLPEALAELPQRWLDATEPFELTLGRREDAHATVDVVHDGSCAWLNLTAPQGGRPLRQEDVEQVLTMAGVVAGIDHALLAQACATGQTQRIVAATAVASRKGDATRFELLVADTRDRAPKVDEHGLIDYHELGDIPMVKAGQPLMRRHPPTSGADGSDVRGNTLRASPGLDEPFDTSLPGSAMSADDPDVLVATCGGQPVHIRNGVSVEQVLHLKFVNMATGNVHFDGTVEVAGDVAPGMRVEVSGDIIVKGMVEGAQLEAGGSIRVAGGVISHSALRAGASASVRFVESSGIHAGTAVVVENMASHSDLQALNQVLVGTAAGPRGKLVGGSTRATMLVRAPRLGASAGGLTKVQVGVNPALEAHCHDLEALIDQESVEADKLQKVIQHLKAHGDPRGMLVKVQAAWQQALQVWSASLAEKAQLDQQLALIRTARIELTSGLDGDVDIAFGKVVRRLRTGYGAGAFSIDDEGRVVFTPPSGDGAEVV